MRLELSEDVLHLVLKVVKKEAEDRISLQVAHIVLHQEAIMLLQVAQNQLAKEKKQLQNKWKKSIEKTLKGTDQKHFIT